MLILVNVFANINKSLFWNNHYLKKIVWNEYRDKRYVQPTYFSKNIYKKYKKISNARMVGTTLKWVFKIAKNNIQLNISRKSKWTLLSNEQKNYLQFLSEDFLEVTKTWKCLQNKAFEWHEIAFRKNTVSLKV